jgi:hypothetical protein
MSGLLNGVKDLKSLIGAVLVAVGGALSEGSEGTMSLVGKVLALIGASLVSGTVATAVAKSAPAPQQVKK